MFVELNCPCGSAFQIDAEPEDDNAVWLLVYRFTNAHIECGYVAPVTAEQPATSPTRTVVRVTGDG